MRLMNKVVLITGGGTGIGKAIAKRYAQEGAKVAITGRRELELKRVVADIERTGGRALTLPGSVTDETTDQIWDETFDIFLKGTFRFIRAAIPYMLKQGGGSIINISTVVGLKAISGFPAHAYQAAKAGMNMPTKTVAVEYAKQGIRCKSICPGGVLTPPVEEMLKNPATKSFFEHLHSMGRLGQPNDIAEPAIYFASDQSHWTTGSILTVDGGMMAA